MLALLAKTVKDRMLPSYDPNDSEAGMKLLEDLTSNAHQIQQRVLEEILARNSQTEYLNRFLNGHSDTTLFKKKVPVVNYEDVKAYIERIANGEPSHIISSHQITELLTRYASTKLLCPTYIHFSEDDSFLKVTSISHSSGTSGGQPKMMPSTAEDLDRKTFFYNILVPVMNR